jgi:hypothetical protein
MFCPGISLAESEEWELETEGSSYIIQKVEAGEMAERLKAAVC